MPIPKARGFVRTISTTNPSAGGMCDRCGTRYSLVDLEWQWEYQGSGLINKRILVCPVCIDEPQPQLLSPRLPPDPLPVANPRPEPYAQEEGGPPGPAQPQLTIPPQIFPPPPPVLAPPEYIGLEDGSGAITTEGGAPIYFED